MVIHTAMHTAQSTLHAANYTLHTAHGIRFLYRIKWADVDENDDDTHFGAYSIAQISWLTLYQAHRTNMKEILRTISEQSQSPIHQHTHGPLSKTGIKAPRDNVALIEMMR